MKIPSCGNWIWQKDTDPAVLLPWFSGGTVRDGLEVKRNACRTVYLVTAGDGAKYYAKLERTACVWFRNKAKIEFEAGRMLQKAGIPCVEFVACGRRGLHETVLVSRAIENAVDAREYFFSIAAHDPVRRQNFLNTLTLLQQKMRVNGIRHRDFHAGNILVREEGSGDCTLLFVDPVAVSHSNRADDFELARILNDFSPLLTDTEALVLAGNDPDLLALVVADRKEKCCREWEKRKAQILSGKSKFSRMVTSADGRAFEVASTPWYKPGKMPDDLENLSFETLPADVAEARWLAMFRARLEGSKADQDYLLREKCGVQTRLYYRKNGM